jgi:branched-chain amino acid aminotransferase
VSERVFDVKEMLEWVKTGEAALSGTAAVLAGVGTLIYQGVEHRVAGGDVGPQTRALRSQLVAIQQGEAPDNHGWLQRI